MASIIVESFNSRIVVDLVNPAGGGCHTQDLCIHNTHYCTRQLLTQADLNKVRVHSKTTPTNRNNLSTKQGPEEEKIQTGL